MTADDFSDSFYYRAIRTKIGEALRSHFVPTQLPPKRLLDLLQRIDQPRGDDTARTEGEQQSTQSEANKFEK
jgi:hypothetical protein